jgi:magnesium-transporting ATPase (P-type)
MYEYYPKMYLISQKNQMFTNLIFLSWFVLGMLQGVVCLMITLYTVNGVNVSSGKDSYETGFYLAGLSSYTSVIIVVTLKLAINVRNWNMVLVLGFLIPSLGAYVIFCVLLDLIQASSTYLYWSDLIVVPSFYQANVLAILGMFTVDLLLFSIEATKNNFQNYFKKSAMTKRKMSE